MSAQIPHTLIEWVLVVIGGSTLIVFAVALQHFFIQPAGLTRPQRLFQDLSVLLGIVHGIALIVLNSASDRWALAGIVMFAASLILFLRTIEAVRRTPMTRTFVYEPRCDRILRTGPYSVIQHPIYVAYSLAWFATPIATHSMALGASAVVMAICYAISAREEERRLASGPRGAEYEQYRATTWRVLPFIY